jgi:hypothetical protein
VAKKLGLLQSKRPFPGNNEVEDDDEVAFLHGMNAFLRRDPNQTLGVLHRTFSFNADCVYGAIHAASEQVVAIGRLNREFGKAIYYLLYNPPKVPVSVSYPLPASADPSLITSNRAALGEPGDAASLRDGPNIPDGSKPAQVARSGRRPPPSRYDGGTAPSAEDVVRQAEGRVCRRRRMIGTHPRQGLG